MLKYLFFLPLFAFALTGYSQTTDSLTAPSAVKTLSLKEYTALQKGDDHYRMALAAEINHFPAPGNVLKFKKELDLSPQQVSNLTAMNIELLRKKKEMGVFIIRNERMIDSLFATRKMNDGKLIFYTNQYGSYIGELRNAILQACLATQKLLTPAQVTRFEKVYYGK